MYFISTKAATRLKGYVAPLVLFAFNCYLCKELFSIEYGDYMGSIEAAFIAIARYVRDNWTDLSWWPMWYSGIPYQDSYPPLLHAVVALASGVSGVSVAHAYHFVTATLFCFGPVTLYWLTAGIWPPKSLSRLA